MVCSIYIIFKFITPPPSTAFTSDNLHVNSLIVTTSCKQPPPVSDYFENDCRVSQSNTVPRALA